MQRIILVSITADHDFGALITQRAFAHPDDARAWIYGGALDDVYAKANAADPRNADIHHFTVTQTPVAFGAEGKA